MLSAALLKTEFLGFFGSAPSTYEGCGQAWADAVGAYAASITPPSTSVQAAATSLAQGLGAAFALPSGTAAMESAFASFAAAVGLGMAGYVPTPPPGPVGFLAAFSQAIPKTHEEAADRMAGLIHGWMTTGLATLAVPPGTVVPWS